MRLFYLLISLLLIAALVVPFYLKDAAGVPLVTVDQVIDGQVPAAVRPATSVYRWQDERGVWQFGDAPPLDANAELIEIESRVTPMGSAWSAPLVPAAGDPSKQSPGSAGGAGPPGGIPNLGDIYDGRALEKARAAAELIEQHTRSLEQLRERTTP